MKKQTDEARIKIYAWLSMAVIVIWAMSFIFGSRLPYLYTDFAFKVRAFVIFPVLLGTLSYFAFLYKNERSGWRTGYNIVMKGLPSRREKIKRILLTIVAFPALSAAFSWTFIAFPILAAELTASTLFSQTYTITEIRARGGAVWSTLFDLTLVKDASETVDLRLNRRRYEAHHWKVGDVICVRGRTSIFGSIADTVTKGPC
jgi:hypothetical protein